MPISNVISQIGSLAARPFQRRLPQNLTASASPFMRQPTRVFAGQGDRILSAENLTPTAFQLELQKIVMNRLASKNAKVKEAYDQIAGELTALPESVAATPGFAGLNLDQARRLQSIQGGGLQNIMTGLSGGLERQQQRTDYLGGLATSAYAEDLQRQAAQSQALQREKEKGEERELQLTELALGLPQGQSIDLLGRTVRGLQPLGAGAGVKNRIVTPQEGGYYAVDDQGRIIGGRDPYGQTFGFENIPGGERGFPVTPQEGAGTSLVADFSQVFFGSSKNKYGLDFAGKFDSPIRSSGSGTVVSVGPNGDWGNQVKIRDEQGNIHQYSHLNSIDVEVGQTIATGESLGTMGNTGNVLKATGEPVSDEERAAGRGTHLDYTVYRSNGEPYSAQEAARFAGYKPGKALEEQKKITRQEAEAEANRRNITEPQKVMEFVNAAIRNNEFPKLPEKEVDVSQANAALFAARTKEAESVFNEVEPFLKRLSPTEFFAYRNAPSVGGLKNIFLPEFFQRQEQAERNFVNSVLRRESGAVISPKEFESAALQYFPMPGDTEKTLQQKKQNRETVIRGLEFAAGNVGRKFLDVQHPEKPPQKKPPESYFR